MIRAHPFIVICIATLFGSSLWFSINAVSDQLLAVWGIGTVGIGHLTGVLQFGFILGTLSIALTGVADRYSPSVIFFASSILGALANSAFPLAEGSMNSALVLRFIVGVSLAGIYPIGMKLVVNWAPGKTGNVLGWMVGMLAIGSGAPHLVRGLEVSADWRYVLYVTSALACIGGLIIFRLGDGVSKNVNSNRKNHKALGAFRIKNYRATAFGYFGHMWELYAFFALVPVMLSFSGSLNGKQIYLVSFVVFAISGVGCIIGGALTKYWGSAKIAICALVGSGLMCFIIPLVHELSTHALIGAIIVWGLFVAADSPQFSSLAARACPAEQVGGALAMMNCIGFSLTIVSIEIVSSLWGSLNVAVAWILLPGPIVGLYSMRRLWRSDAIET